MGYYPKQWCRECHKYLHPVKGSAEAEMKRLAVKPKAGKPSRYFQMNVYPCTLMLGGWHVGHTKRKYFRIDNRTGT